MIKKKKICLYPSRNNVIIFLNKKKKQYINNNNTVWNLNLQWHHRWDFTVTIPSLLCQRSGDPQPSDNSPPTLLLVTTHRLSNLDFVKQIKPLE